MDRQSTNVNPSPALLSTPSRLFEITGRTFACALCALLVVLADPLVAAPPASQESLAHFQSRIPRSIVLAERPDLFDLDAITLEAWVYLESYVPATHLICRSCSSTAARLVMDYSNGQHALVEVNGTGSGLSLQSPSPLPLRTWVHVAGIITPTSLELVIDGVSVASTSWSFDMSELDSTPWVLGDGLHGALAQVRVWNVARSVADIDAHRNAYVPPSTPGLVAYWPLDDGQGDQARDLVAPGAPATLGDEFGGPPVWVARSLLEAGPYFVRHDYSGPPTGPDGALLDLDDDDDLDFIRAGWVENEFMLQVAPFWEAPAPQPLSAFRNDGGTFTEATADLLEPDAVQMVRPDVEFAVADFNGDMADDLLIPDAGPDPLPPPCVDPPDLCTPGAIDRLLLQSPSGHLDDVTNSHLPPVQAFSNGSCHADIDGDGDEDVLIVVPLDHKNICRQGAPFPANAPCTHFLINDGTGHFTQDLGRLPEVLAVMELENGHPQQSLGCLFIQANADDAWDLFLAAHSFGEAMENLLLINDGDGNFSFAPDGALPQVGDLGVLRHAVAGDFDADGTMDIMTWAGLGCTTPGAGDCQDGFGYVLVGDGLGSFTANLDLYPYERSWRSGDTPAQMRSADLNGDGRDDAIVGGHPHRTRLLLNDPALGLRFPPTQAVGGFAASDILILPADVDGDLDIDLVLDDGGTEFYVLENVKPIPSDFEDPVPGRTCIAGPEPDCALVTPMFADGFETADTSRWSRTTPAPTPSAEQH